MLTLEAAAAMGKHVIQSISPSACRYCDAACAKAHWKHHKASCKRAAAAAGAATGAAGQE